MSLSIKANRSMISNTEILSASHETASGQIINTLIKTYIGDDTDHQLRRMHISNAFSTISEKYSTDSLMYYLLTGYKNLIGYYIDIERYVTLLFNVADQMYDKHKILNGDTSEFKDACVGSEVCTELIDIFIADLKRVLNKVIPDSVSEIFSSINPPSPTTPEAVGVVLAEVRIEAVQTITSPSTPNNTRNLPSSQRVSQTFEEILRAGSEPLNRQIATPSRPNTPTQPVASKSAKPEPINHINPDTGEYEKDRFGMLDI